MQANRAAAAGAPARETMTPYRRAENVVISKRDGTAGGSRYFVRTPKQLYEFGPEEHLLCQLLDGKRSIPEIQAEFRQQLGKELTRESLDRVVAELLKLGIVEPDPGLAEAPVVAAAAQAAFVAPPSALAAPLSEALSPPTRFAPAGTTAIAVASELPAPQDPRPDGAAEPAIDEYAALTAELEAATSPRRRRIRLRLFDPVGLLAALDRVAAPLRFYRWMVLPLTLVALAVVPGNSSAIAADLAAAPTARLAVLALAALLLVDVLPVLAQAVAASFSGTPSRQVGLGFAWGVPRLRFSDADWQLDEASALRVTAAPLTTRLALFAVGNLAWLVLRGTAVPAELPLLALLTGLLALVGSLLGAAPFAASTARRWLRTLLGNTAGLWRSGGFFRAHLLALSLLWGITALGVAALLLTIALRTGLLHAHDVAAFGGRAGITLPPHIAARLERLSLPLLVMGPVAGWLWLRMLVRGQGLGRVTFLPADGAQALADQGELPASRAPGIVVPFDRDGMQITGPMRRRLAGTWASTRTLVVTAAVAAVLLAVALVPYPYDAGGNFTVLPHDSSQLNARLSGELTEVLVNEGDKVVPGQIVGILSDWDQKANLSVSQAQLENAKANLQALYETPKPEDVELARKQYELAISKLPYDKAQYDRASMLVKTDAVSRSNYDQIVSQYQQDQAAADVARANYDDVRTGPTPGQLDAARSLVRQYAATVAYNEDQLERTRVRATSYGTIVTPNPMLLRGQWFAQGAMVLTVQDLRTVQADVQVPEMDIGHVLLTGTVRLRPWGFPTTTFRGRTIGIAGDAQPDPGGSGTNIVRVRTEIANPDGALHPNTTGYAKLTGPYMPTWAAWTQMVIRFFMIEIWSFIP